MSNNNYLIMRILLGALLAYQGAKLLGSLIQDKPDNYIFMSVIAIAFIAIGAVFAVNAIKGYIKLIRERDVDVITYEDMKKKETESQGEVEDKEGKDESCE